MGRRFGSPVAVISVNSIDSKYGNTGANVYDLADDAPFVMFNRATGSLAGSMDLNSETLDLLTFTTGTNWTLLSGTNLYSGRYTISALFEPSALASLAIMILGLVGLPPP